MRAALLPLLLLFAGCVAPAPSSPEPGAAQEDPWGGAETLTLLDEEVTVMGLAHGGGPDRCLLRCAGSVLTTGARLVPHDTARVEVAASWEGGPAALRFVYDHGASAEAVEETLARDAPLAIPVTQGMADAPGQRHSHWWWGFFVADEAGVVPETPVHVRVLAYRSLDPIAPPAARDVWAQADASPIVEPLPRENRIAYVPGTARCIECDGTWWSSAPGGIVAPGATHVRTRVEWSGDGPFNVGAFVPPETVLTLDLVEEGPDFRTYEIPVDPADLDSPDQTKSLWWFFVQREGAPAGVYDATVTLVAEAVRAG